MRLKELSLLEIENVSGAVECTKGNIFFKVVPPLFLFGLGIYAISEAFGAGADSRPFDEGASMEFDPLNGVTVGTLRNKFPRGKPRGIQKRRNCAS